MLRRNPTTGAWERREGDQWVPAPAPDAGVRGDSDVSTGGGLDDAIAGAFSDADAPLPAASDPEPAPVAASSSSGPVAPEHVSAASVAMPVDGGDPDRGMGRTDGGAAKLPAHQGFPVESGPPEEIPGLVSGDGQRGTSGQKSVRERLQGMRNRGSARRTQSVQVGPRSAKAVGPAVRESTEARQTAGQRKTVTVGPRKQRYANRPAPSLLTDRPKWVQELFEAHFRSEQALQLRREHNRMKISRTDYAIGWLTAFDKFREEPSILRLKERTNGAQGVTSPQTARA